MDGWEGAWTEKGMHDTMAVETSVPKRPVRTMVRAMGRQSGQSGHGFEKPGSVRLKFPTAAKACRRPGNRRVERIGDPGKAARCPGNACRCPGKAARCPGKACRSRVKPPDTLTTSAARVKLNTDWLSCSLMTF